MKDRTCNPFRDHGADLHQGKEGLIAPWMGLRCKKTSPRMEARRLVFGWKEDDLALQEDWLSDASHYNEATDQVYRWNSITVIFECLSITVRNTQHPGNPRSCTSMPSLQHSLHTLSIDKSWHLYIYRDTISVIWSCHNY